MWSVRERRKLVVILKFLTWVNRELTVQNLTQKQTQKKLREADFWRNRILSISNILNLIGWQVICVEIFLAGTWEMRGW